MLNKLIVIGEWMGIPRLLRILGIMAGTLWILITYGDAELGVQNKPVLERVFLQIKHLCCRRKNLLLRDHRIQYDHALFS